MLSVGLGKGQACCLFLERGPDERIARVADFDSEADIYKLDAGIYRLDKGRSCRKFFLNLRSESGIITFSSSTTCGQRFRFRPRKGAALV